MRVFYSELTANPAYYSFGYSIYGTLENGESLEESYEKGFLPFVGAKEQDPKTVYMARGTRVRLEEFVSLHYHHRVERKAEELLKQKLDVHVYEWPSFAQKEKVRVFFQRYFTFRFGKEAMPEERLRALFASPFLTHIVEYRLQGICIAYSLEVHTATLIHVWHQAYLEKYTGKHIGIYIYLELIRRAKAAGKKYLYFGVTYGKWMSYKTYFQPLEFWDGASWIHDSKSARLKKLFVEDASRLLGFTDQWRENKKPFYETPYPMRSGSDVLKLLFLLVTLFPRVFGYFILAVSIVLMYFVFRLIIGLP